MTATAGMHIICERDVACEMRDGTVLRADVYRPDDTGPLPVLLHRIPYGKDHPLCVTNLMFPPIVAAARGYAVVVQDVRGRGASDGRWEPLRPEASDGYDSVEWAAAQPWADGRVGVYGSSYMGVTALQAVAAAPPHLAAAVAYLTGASYHDGWVHSGGAFELVFNLRWAAAQALAEAHRTDLDDPDRQAALARLRWITDNPFAAARATPLAEVFGPADPLVPYWREWLARPRRDGYWAAVDARQGLSAATVPVLSILGWYDGFLRAHLDAVAALDDALHAGRSPSHEIIIGPWDHEAYQGTRANAAGEELFGSEAASGAAGLGETILSFFDRVLRPDSAEPTPPEALRVRYFVVGANQWRRAHRWPPAGDHRRWYLRSDGAGGRTLSPEAPEVSAADTFRYDPLDPVPTRGGRHLGYWYGRAGIVDQAGLEARDDLLCYTGSHLVEPLELAGPVRVRLYARSGASHTDLTAKLIDVRPDGYAANIAEGIVRVTPDIAVLDGASPAQVEIDLCDVAYRLEAGHRLRLEVASSNFPRFDRHGNLPGVPAHTAEEDWAATTQEIRTGPATPSHVSFVVPHGTGH